ncbi:mas-related G-protein coupled receptor member H-like [Dendropsophus ebraccatus]|uniref:mas-related G-protein coupled receptor member H-like n=1 Tax=Dendropsophus ebraccatus TaxID=150705 RepID=UPI003832205A
MNNSTVTPTVPDQNITDGDYPGKAEPPWTVIFAIAIVFCLIGLVGNIIVFWYLCFKIKKNKYTIYIINLSVADFIYLIFTIPVLILYINTLTNPNPNFEGKDSVYLFFEILCDSGQYSGMFILTAISLERCLSVLFPLWYQCHRPQNLSTIICTALWVIGCSESLIENLVCSPEDFVMPTTACTAVQIIVFGLSIVICLPIMVISSLTLLIKIKRTFSEQYPQKLYIIIITAVFVFIISVIPMNFLWFFLYFDLLSDDKVIELYYAGMFCVVLNCTIDPYIYFIVGKKWKQKTSHSIQDALQRAFRTEDDENDDSSSNKTSNTSSQTNLAITF